MAAFPRESIAWKLEEVTMLRRISLSLPLYGIAAGIVVRAYRWVVFSVIAPNGVGALVGLVAVGAMLICALAAGHLANYTMRAWRWRAPAFGAVLALGESLASLALTAFGLERSGRVVATFADWPGASIDTLLTRVLAVSLFAIALAAVVTGLRKAEEAGRPGA